MVRERSSYRNGSSRLSLVYSNLGFRSVNGVSVRGHNYLYSSYRGLRSGVRLYLAGVYIQTGFSNVGFAVNGVLMGGANSNAAMYVRCGGYRNADGTRWNAPTAARGFRLVCEWCTKGWSV